MKNWCDEAVKEKAKVLVAGGGGGGGGATLPTSYLTWTDLWIQLGPRD